MHYICQDSLLFRLCQIQKGDWHLRIVQNVVHRYDGKSCIDQTS